MASETIVSAMAAILALPVLLAAQGLPAEWEVREWAVQLGKQMEELTPAIERLNASQWSGAPAAYAEQQAMASRETGYAAAAAREMAERPTGLGKAFELHLRVQAVEGLVTSLAAGARSYQYDGPADDALNQMAKSREIHNRLRDYIMDLATTKEQELIAIDAEAQRCRAILLRAPAVKSAPTRSDSKKTSK